MLSGNQGRLCPGGQQPEAALALLSQSTRSGPRAGGISCLPRQAGWGSILTPHLGGPTSGELALQEVC